VRSDEKNADLIGAEVLKIEDASPGEVLKRSRSMHRSRTR
jgi:hypothetical protein